jgi:L-cysteine desulfidase|tara:strand:+ start:1625 stop:1834 length:210 start_codon:yes stop_codon:yes gene_type:complete
MKKINRDPKISDFVDGLYVKNGRLINGRPNGMMGIEQAANMKRIIDEDRKIKMIADGIERAEMRKDLFG